MNPSSSDHENEDTSFASENKELRKKLRNRESAQRARDRQKARMQWLEQKVTLLQIRNEVLTQENFVLKSILLSCDAKNSERAIESKLPNHKQTEAGTQETIECHMDCVAEGHNDKYSITENITSVKASTTGTNSDAAPRRKHNQHSTTNQHHVIKRSLSSGMTDTKLFDWLNKPNQPILSTHRLNSMLQNEAANGMFFFNPYINSSLSFATGDSG